MKTVWSIAELNGLGGFEAGAVECVGKKMKQGLRRSVSMLPFWEQAVVYNWGHVFVCYKFQACRILMSLSHGLIVVLLYIANGGRDQLAGVQEDWSVSGIGVKGGRICGE